MSNTFEPKHVPSDIVARWPMMALTLWKRSFKHQTAVLLSAALMIKIFPAWSTALAFFMAPSLFIVSFATVQIADERTRFSWEALLHLVLPGALRLGKISLQFALVFGLGVGALASLSSALLPDASMTEQHAMIEQAMKPPSTTSAASEPPSNLMIEFFHFCATWTEGVMAMVFLGMFIVAIYQGIFGVILHAQERIGARESRIYGWQAWQINSASIEKALHDAPPIFWYYLATLGLVVIGSFQTVYLSPIGLVLATYIPCLAYVAYKSIFLGKHENVTASARVPAERTGRLAPAVARFPTSS